MLTMANAFAGLRIRAPLLAFGVIDAMPKLGVGVVMLIVHPALTCG
ncbi:hypothetical protein GCM10009733_060010 [Nonomuraea maheshkhaliensis]|uniref:MFS transporter n=1 Tax=Nonomuraea maheshkhaliensis TaxID=419590 RepID=A0ABP4RIN8_9ACTN